MKMFYKQEPVKHKKVFEHKARTIKSPHFVIQVLLATFTSFVRGNASKLLELRDFVTSPPSLPPFQLEANVSSIDEVTSEVRAYQPFFMIGADITSELPHLHSPDRRYVMADVSAWDKTVPSVFFKVGMDTLMPTIGARMFHSLIVKPIVYYAGTNFTPPRHLPRWCSGCLLTLWLNSMVNASILFVACAGYRGLLVRVQGDDCFLSVPAAKHKQGTLAAAVRRGYERCGLRVKLCEERLGTFEFCKTYVREDGKSVLDIAGIANKTALGARGFSSLAALAKSADYVSRGSVDRLASEGVVLDAPESDLPF